MIAQTFRAARPFVSAAAAISLLLPTTSPFAEAQTTAPPAAGAAESPAPVTPQDVYSGLVAETFRGLLQEVVVLGLFVVGIGSMRQAVRDSNYSRTSSFRKRLTLLAAVLLFAIYTKLTYSVEWALGPEDVLRRSRTAFTNHERNMSALLIVVLVPVDLMIVVILAGMFLVLARDDYISGEGAVLDEVRSLYKLTRATHFVTLVWWIIFTAFSNGGTSHWPDMLYHSGFVGAHSGGLALLSYARKHAPTSRDLDRAETMHVALYSFFAISVYASRIWIYIYKYTT